MRKAATLAVALCALAACQKRDSRQPPAPSVAEAPPAPPIPPPPPAPVAGNRVAAKSDLLDFSYAWPDLPGGRALGAWLARDEATTRKQAEDGAREDAAAAKASGYPFNPHSSAKSWSIAGATPALVSLSAELSEYSGGAHPNSGFQALLWDREADTPLAFAALLADRGAGLSAIAARFCPALNVERGSPVRADSTDEFDVCPALARETIVPAGSRSGAFTRLRILLGPYDAGPYVEGAYEIEVPVTRAFVVALEPKWRSSFDPR